MSHRGPTVGATSPLLNTGGAAKACLVALGASSTFSDQTVRAPDLADAVEDLLLASHWPVGESFATEAELSERLGVGRGLCREALRILQNRGAVTIRPGASGGLIVSRPTAQSVADGLLFHFLAFGVTASDVLDARLRLDHSADWNAGGTAATTPSLALAAACVSRLEQYFDPGPDEGVLGGTDGREDLPARKAFLIANELASLIPGPGEEPRRIASAWDISNDYGVGGPVVKQAFRILQDRGVLHCRRGRGGGGVLCRPDISAARRVTNAYFASHHCGEAAGGELVWLNNRHNAWVAASQKGGRRRADLEAAALDLRRRKAAASPVDILALLRLVADVGGNAILQTLSICAVSFGLRSYFDPTVPMTAEGVTFAEAMVTAILEGAPDRASQWQDRLNSHLQLRLEEGLRVA